MARKHSSKTGKRSSRSKKTQPKLKEGHDAEVQALGENDEREEQEAQGLERDERITRGYEAPGAGA